ncbi:MAG: ABC transporter permease [Phycisphaerales bacterium]|nr:ABC transporter permease [Planctomycetota bacterium]MCH8507753.1 ABC transporter permease [Phycisphaerales bacterium]
MTPFAALFKRELLRQVRQPTRIVAAVATPAMIWIFLAAGFAGSTELGVDADMRAFLIPGIASMTVLFASIFASISLIQDRADGFLRAALVSPAPRSSIAAAKIAAGVLMATAQGLIVLLALPATGHAVTLTGMLAAIGVLACIACALIGFGLTLAWRVDSTQGYHGVMNAILMPMWLLSGAVFPVETAAGWLAAIARVNPLTWCHDAMRHAFSMAPSSDPVAAWAVTILFAAAGLAAGVRTLGRSAHPARKPRRTASRDPLPSTQTPDPT